MDEDTLDGKGQPDAMNDADHRLVRIRFRVTPDEDGWPDFEWERLWAEPSTEGFIVQNIPFYLNDLGLHDVVAAPDTDEEGNHLFERVIRHSGHRTIRLVVKDGHDIEGVCGELEHLGCGFEQDGRFLAVDVPPHVDGRTVKDYLDTDEAGAGRFGIDEAHVDWYGPDSFGHPSVS